jgi:hypothetical protein
MAVLRSTLLTSACYDHDGLSSVAVCPSVHEHLPRVCQHALVVHCMHTVKRGQQHVTKHSMWRVAVAAARTEALCVQDRGGSRAFLHDVLQHPSVRGNLDAARWGFHGDILNLLNHTGGERVRHAEVRVARQMNASSAVRQQYTMQPSCPSLIELIT